MGDAPGNAHRFADGYETVRTGGRILGLLGAVVVSTAAPAVGQTWRTLTLSRPVHGESTLTVDVQYGAGRFRLTPGGSRTLYRVEMNYDEDRFTPVREFDAEASVVRLGLRGRSGSSMRVSVGDRRRERQPATFDLSLSPDIPLTLNLELGAVESDVELGGLALRRVTYRTGASSSNVRFSRANPVACDDLQLEAGAAEMHVTSIANSNCAHLSFRGGVGEVNLDFSGDWRRSLDADVDVSIGSLTLGLPRDVGVAIRVNRFLASFESAGFTKHGAMYYSTNYSTARYRLALRVNATIGGIDVNWID